MAHTAPIRDQDRLRLRALLIAGAESVQKAPVDSLYFDILRERVRKAVDPAWMRNAGDEV
jgi:antitoxin ParD1/3/4